MTKKRFHLGDVLSVTTGVLLSPTRMEGVHDILNHVTGDPGLFTHQLPRAALEVESFLKAQFPQLADADVEGITNDNYQIRMNGLITQYGEWFEVEAMPDGAHEVIDPFSELAEKVHPSKIVVVKG